MDHSKSDAQSSLPPGAVKIGTVRFGEKPRTSSFASNAAMVVGYITSFFGSAVAQDIVSELAKEDLSKYALVKGEGFASAFQKGLSRSVDLKLWKSNIANIVTFLGGALLTNFAVRKIEEHTFAKRHGELPRMDQVNQILAGDSYPTSEQKKTHWQDKTKRSEEAQNSASII
ncbi:MAG: hypothetical protein ACK5WQ_04505 [Alphaproteobacteria bacterium]|jgi:hypothetical protein